MCADLEIFLLCLWYLSVDMVEPNHMEIVNFLSIYQTRIQCQSLDRELDTTDKYNHDLPAEWRYHLRLHIFLSYLQWKF